MQKQIELAKELRKSKKPRLKNVGGGRLVAQDTWPTDDATVEMAKKLAYAQACADEDVMKEELAKADILIAPKKSAHPTCKCNISCYACTSHRASFWC